MVEDDIVRIGSRHLDFHEGNIFWVFDRGIDFDTGRLDDVGDFRIRLFSHVFGDETHIDRFLTAFTHGCEGNPGHLHFFSENVAVFVDPRRRFVTFEIELDPVRAHFFPIG